MAPYHCSSRLYDNKTVVFVVLNEKTEAHTSLGATGITICSVLVHIFLLMNNIDVWKSVDNDLCQRETLLYSFCRLYIAVDMLCVL